MKLCHLVCAGDFDPALFSPNRGELVIACDGGLAHLDALGIKPDIVVGDFDSYRAALPQDVKVVRLKPMKDDTDSEHALRLGLSMGYRCFLLHGALGGRRISHSFANISLLSLMREKDARGLLLGRETVAGLLENESIAPVGVRGYFSLFAMNDHSRVQLCGMKYPYEGLVEPSSTLCQSNEFTEEQARITAHEGKLLFVFEGKASDPRVFFDIDAK